MKRRIFRRASITTAGLLALILLIGLVGWVGDMFAVRGIRSLSDSSLQHFSESKKAGCQKPTYYSNMEDGQAWDMYERATVAAKSIDDWPIIYFLYPARQDAPETPVDSTTVALIVSRNDSVIAFLKAGVRLKECSIPRDYEEGWAYKLLDFMALRSAARLLACRAHLRARGDPESAVMDMIDGSVFSHDIAAGDVTTYGHGIGFIVLRTSTRQMQHALSQFYLEYAELQKLTSAMNTLANTWPPLSRALDADWRIQAISFDKLSLESFQTQFLYMEPSNQFLYWLMSHLSSWRHIFSLRRAQLGALNSQVRMVQELTRAEQEGWPAIHSTVVAWESRITAGGNSVLKQCVPGLMMYYAGRFRGITLARLAGASALIEMHFLKNGRWPERLDLLKTDGLEDLLIDPMSGKQLKYLVYPGQDSVAVYSVGANMVDDGGFMGEGEEKEDLVFVLHRPEDFR